jgi:hypothetical protein
LDEVEDDRCGNRDEQDLSRSVTIWVERKADSPRRDAGQMGWLENTGGDQIEKPSDLRSLACLRVFLGV